MLLTTSRSTACLRSFPKRQRCCVGRNPSQHREDARMGDYIFNLADVGLDKIALVGGKNASSGELIGKLAAWNIRVPQGFAVSAEGYRDLLQGSKLYEPIARTLAAY